MVGANGSGKSTLLRLIAGELETEGGFANPRGKVSIGNLHQEPRFDPAHSVWEEALTASREVRRLEKTISRVEAQMGDPKIYVDENKLARKVEEHAQLLEDYTKMGGPGYEGQMRATLLNLGFKEEELALSVTALSGGQKKMVGLAKLLVTRPDLLLLDEPDNHLDTDGKAFLESYIRGYACTVVIVSHDRYLLDVVADEIAELEFGKLTIFPGNYSEYAFEKEQRLHRQEHLYKVQQKEIGRLEQSAQRLIIWGRSRDNEDLIRRGKNILKRIERLDKVEKPITERKTMGLELLGWRGSNKVLEVNGLRKGFDGADILSEVDLTIWHGERVGLVGPNGAGKSLLFRHVLGQEVADAGEIKLGPSIEMAYYSQEHQTLDYERTLIDTIRQARAFSEGAAVNHLGRFLFSYAQARGKVRELSGGERSRLQMALIMLSGANFLLLDEPTNNLDIPSAEVLEDSLGEFEGTVFVISHDRYFLDRVATRIIEIEEGGAVEYPGSYSDYQAAKTGAADR
ncbi:MAG: ABC transporter ATP-binding protein [Chloroflexi bacterium]|nr:ABC transporter ATP-binding protein [Chloroflexota bacterium]